MKKLPSGTLDPALFPRADWRPHAHAFRRTRVYPQENGDRRILFSCSVPRCDVEVAAMVDAAGNVGEPIVRPIPPEATV